MHWLKTYTFGGTGILRGEGSRNSHPVVRHAVCLAVLLIALMVSPSGARPAGLGAAPNPLATPSGTVRFYLHALGSGQCALAFKFAGQGGRSLSAFRRSCRAIRRIVVEQLNDPGYRLHPQTAAYTCLSVRYTVYRSSGTTTFGGWYLMERTLGPAWHFLIPLSHVTEGGRATRMTKAQCASHLPSYVHPGSGTIISGFAFRSATAGWVARLPS